MGYYIIEGSKPFNLVPFYVSLARNRALPPAHISFSSLSQNGSTISLSSSEGIPLSIKFSKSVITARCQLQISLGSKSFGNNFYQGDIIGLSRHTGDSTEPHLHFEVLECKDCDSLPINFRNTRIHSNDFVDKKFYEAEAF